MTNKELIKKCDEMEEILINDAKETMVAIRKCLGIYEEDSKLTLSEEEKKYCKRDDSAISALYGIQYINKYATPADYNYTYEKVNYYGKQYMIKLPMKIGAIKYQDFVLDIRNLYDLYRTVCTTDYAIFDVDKKTFECIYRDDKTRLVFTKLLELNRTQVAVMGINSSSPNEVVRLDSAENNKLKVIFKEMGTL